MKIKTIYGKDFREALALVKKELGEDAVILSSKDKKGNAPYVEITAAVDYETMTDGKAMHLQEGLSIHATSGIRGHKNAPSRHSCEGRNPEVKELDSRLSRNIGTGMTCKTCRDDIFGTNRGMDFQSNTLTEIKREIQCLREMIEAMKGGYGITMQSEKEKMLNFLRERSIKEELAVRLVQKARAIDDLKAVVSDDINISLPRGKGIVMLIGPTGVGKTTTVAKLAANAIRQKKMVALLSLDTKKIGAVEQIQVYSKRRGIPFDIVSDREGLRKGIKKFYDRDILLIDTAGKNPKEGEYIRELKDICDTGFPIETHLLLSTSSDDKFLVDTRRYYSAIPIDYLGFTKIDEAVTLGSIYNLSHFYQKPVAYITTGQRIPDDIEFVSRKRLAELVLETVRTQ